MILCLYSFPIILLSIIQTYSQSLTPCQPAHACNIISTSISTNGFQEQCSSHGKCFYDIISYFQSNKTLPFKSCVCDQGWTDDPQNLSVKCCYKKKSQFVAFAFEVFVGFGVGHFYCGNHFLAMIKLMFTILLCCSCCLIAVCFYYKDDPNAWMGGNKSRRIYKESGIYSNYPWKYKLFNVVMIISCLAVVFWQLTDAALFGFNYYTDENGIALEPW